MVLHHRTLEHIKDDFQNRIATKKLDQEKGTAHTKYLKETKSLRRPEAPDVRF